MLNLHLFSWQKLIKSQFKLLLDGQSVCMKSLWFYLHLTLPISNKLILKRARGETSIISLRPPLTPPSYQPLWQTAQPGLVRLISDTFPAIGLGLFGKIGTCKNDESGLMPRNSYEELVAWRTLQVYDHPRIIDCRNLVYC